MQDDDRYDLSSNIDEIGERMDASRIDCYKLCPKKFYWRYEQRIQPKGYEATAANFGGAIHAALATFYEGRAFEPATCPCETVCAICASSKKAWEEGYQGLGNPIPRAYAAFLIHYPKDPEREKDNRTRDFGLQLIYEYIKKYGNEVGVKVLAVEETFVIPYPEFNLVGRIDLLLRTSIDIILRDIKTSSRVDLLLLTAALSMQAGIYMLAMSKIFKQHVGTEEIDALHTGKYSKERFVRHTVTMTPEDLELIEKELLYYWERIKENRRDGLWPANRGYACTAYNGVCEYYNICYSKDNPEIIENSYERIERVTI